MGAKKIDMKKNGLFIILGILLLSGSCRKKETVECSQTEYQRRKQEVVGKWAVRPVKRRYSNDSLLGELTYAHDLNYEFKDDGTGFMPNLNVDIDTDIFEWIYQDEPRKVMIRRITNDGQIYPSPLKFFSVLEVKEDYMHWMYRDTAGFWTPDTIYRGYLEIEWEMFRR